MVKVFRKRPTNDECANCRSHSTKVVTYSDTVDFRGLQLDVENLQTTKCGECGRSWNTDQQRVHNDSIIREAYGVERDRLRAIQGLLSGDEIAGIRTRFGLNQREAARLFGGGYNAFNKYESGEVLQSAAMDRLLRLAGAVGPEAINFLRDVRATPRFAVVGASTTITFTRQVPRPINSGLALMEYVNMGEWKEAGGVSALQALDLSNASPGNIAIEVATAHLSIEGASAATKRDSTLPSQKVGGSALAAATINYDKLIEEYLEPSVSTVLNQAYLPRAGQSRIRNRVHETSRR